MKNAVIFCFFLLHIAIFASSTQANIVINEILYNPLNLNQDEEFLEIYNPSSKTIDLSNWSLSDGVQFDFPSGTLLEGEDYLIVSPSPDAFLLAYPNKKSIGPYSGHMSNDGERIELLDSTGSLVDRVSYRDEQGWPQEADGYGYSLERIHPQMDGSQPESWRAGPIGGTPGSENVSSISKPVAIVKDLRQIPTVPTSNQSVRILCHVMHVLPIESVILWYKKEYDESYQTIECFDDGEHNDGVAADGTYGAEIPPQPNESIIEFAITAADIEGESGWFPLGGLNNASIYRVDDSAYDTNLPLYRIVTRTQDEIDLRTRDARSNDELPATFIYGDDIWYNVGLRFRGKGSRGKEPKSYRVNFTNGRYFGSIRKINLNAIDIYNQYVGLECFKRLGLPAPEKQFVSLSFNQSFVPGYIQVERTDQYMMERIFGDGNGNVYRGVEQANLDYRGEDFDSYRWNYEKQTNEREDDYTDLIQLCKAFSETTDDEFSNELNTEINVQQWIRWFALKQALNDREGGISLDRGDDYYIYHNPNDGLFYMLPWDLDTVLVYPIESIHHHRIPSVQRLLRHPDFARFYYLELLGILNNELTQDVMDEIIDETSPIASEATRDQMKAASRDIRASILQSIPLSLTVQSSGENTKTLVLESDPWRFFRGIMQPPLDWNQNGFDDSNWETGPSGFGYGDNDDRTVLEDMRNQYSTVYIRKTFDVANPESINSLALTVLYDDGLVAYINGIEVARENVIGEPQYFSFADGTHEASEPELFQIDNPQELLVAGSNTISAIGLNANLDSSDFSLALRLDASYHENGVVKLEGKSDAAHTKSVRVNGETAQYTPYLASWTQSIELKTGRNLITIESLNSANQVIEATHTALYFGTQPPTDGRETYGDETWTASQSPILITQNIIVPPSDTLTISAGAQIRFSSATGIIVYGTLCVQGTKEFPVEFSPDNKRSNGGTIVVESGAGTTTIRNATFVDSGPLEFRGKNYAAAINVNDSTIEIDGCFLYRHNAGIEAHHSILNVRNNRFFFMGEMLHCNTCLAIVENNRFEQAYGYSDAIDFDYELWPGSVIRNNWIDGSEDDGIDTGDSSPLIEGNIIQNCSNKGVSLEGISNPTLINNVIRNCEIGVASKDSCRALISHNTIVSCTTGVSLYEKNEGRGGGEADIVNTVIWDSQTSLQVDALSIATLHFSDLMQLPDGYDDSNVSIDPQFVDLHNGDFTLQKESPLIDAGTDAAVSIDIVGNKRPSGEAPDIGAYEFQQNTSIHDWSLF